MPKIVAQLEWVLTQTSGPNKGNLVREWEKRKKWSAPAQRSKWSARAVVAECAGKGCGVHKLGLLAKICTKMLTPKISNIFLPNLLKIMPECKVNASTANSKASLRVDDEMRLSLSLSLSLFMLFVYIGKKFSKSRECITKSLEFKKSEFKNIRNIQTIVLNSFGKRRLIFGKTS